MSEKKECTKITKDMVPEGFTLSLAIVDAIPVLLFAVAIIILGIKADFSPLIMLGGFLCFLGGALPPSHHRVHRLPRCAEGRVRRHRCRVHRTLRTVVRLHGSHGGLRREARLLRPEIQLD